MSSTTIRVSERTRDFLERHKREGESFDDVINRLLADDTDPMSGFGAWADSGLADAVEEVREEMDEEFERGGEAAFGGQEHPDT
ncbi:antitoxin VapB family protein [Halobium salinum]|uniref:Antitoxin VapB family protein n=1 Tax=Halobium salinum TaxID=1364940 RepID=A0ABD5P7R9_9EURY|nr:antitoxin VapB family protein [Halobium salinum]